MVPRTTVAGAVLDHDEVGADDRMVLTQRERPGRLVEVTPERRQHAVLAAHVVRAGRDHTERRAPHNKPLRAGLDEVREVGRAVRELQDTPVAVEPRYVGLQVARERFPIEIFARPYRRDLRRNSFVRSHAGHRDTTVQPLIPGAP